MMMHGNRTPSDLRHIQTFTHATLVCYEISLNFNRLKGQKNVGTSRYVLAKTHYYVYIFGAMPKNGRHQHAVQKKENS